MEHYNKLKIKLNIGGPKGNAYYILGIVPSLTSGDNIVEIRNEMMKGDYNNLLKVFKKHFPEVVLYSDEVLNGVDRTLYSVDRQLIEL